MADRRGRVRQSASERSDLTPARQAYGVVLCNLCLMVQGCTETTELASVSAQGPAAEGFHFVDVAARVGISRVVHAGRPGKDHLLDSAGTGAA